MKYENASKHSRTGILLLKISFVLQVILFILINANVFASIAKTSFSIPWFTPYADRIAYSTYISVGSCATQFFLIRLFTDQLSSNRSFQVRDFLGCILAVIFDRSFLILALINGKALGIADIAHLLFLILSILILVAIMISSRILGSVCAFGVLAKTVYNLFIVSQLRNINSIAMVVGIMLCEVLYGLGLAFCLFGIKKQPKEDGIVL